MRVAVRAAARLAAMATAMDDSKGNLEDDGRIRWARVRATTRVSVGVSKDSNNGDSNRQQQ